ncbi:hypothetical protein ACTFIZ_012314 [Dictyostelium cf. discoideum]
MDLSYYVDENINVKCIVNITIEAPQICQKCPNCLKTHRTSCNENSGWCTCDSYTKGLNCDQLNTKISSVLTPTISGGDVTMSGDFSNIYNIRSSITISIGTSICNSIIFSSNKLQIKCTIGAGKGNQQLKLSDGNGATLIYDEFYYRVPCSVECSPFGKCNDRVGICICNDVAIGTDCKTLNLQLDSVISTLVTGGQVYLNGDFSKVKDQSLTIKIGNQECSNVKFNDTKFKVLECLLSFTKENAFEYQYYKCPLDCSTPNGTCDGNTGICICENEHIGNACEFILCPLDCSTPNGTCDGNTAFWYGCEFINVHSIVKPNGTCNGNTCICSCNNKYFGNSCEFIQCSLDCSTPNGTCDINTGVCTCHNERFGTPVCGGPTHGTCYDLSGCICNWQWEGEDCNSKVIIVPEFNTTSPTIVLNETTSSDNSETNIEALINIVAIREIDYNNKVLLIFSFDKWIYYSNNSKLSTYSSNIINKNGLTQFQTIEFAGQQFNMKPSSIKYTIYIDQYPFSTKLNQLQLIISATAKINSDSNSCSNKEFDNTTSETLVDSVPITISNELLDKSLGAISDSHTSQSFIGINIPIYNKNVIIDPDFSLLLNSNPSTNYNSICSQKSPGLSKAKLAGIIISCCAIAIAITVATVVTIKKKRNLKKEIKVFNNKLIAMK